MWFHSTNLRLSRSASPSASLCRFSRTVGEEAARKYLGEKHPLGWLNPPPDNKYLWMTQDNGATWEKCNAPDIAKMPAAAASGPSSGDSRMEVRCLKRLGYPECYWDCPEHGEKATRERLASSPPTPFIHLTQGFGSKASESASSVTVEGPSKATSSTSTRRKATKRRLSSAAHRAKYGDWKHYPGHCMWCRSRPSQGYRFDKKKGEWVK